MVEKLIVDQYGLTSNQWEQINGYQAFWIDQVVYLIVPVGNMEQGQLLELQKISQHMSDSGDPYTAIFVKTLKGEWIVNGQDGPFVLLLNRRFYGQKRQNLGRSLGKFHYRGRAIPFKVEGNNRIGQWKSLWERRIDQMERVWQETLYQHPNNEFEQNFIESFPYFMGLAENAIQYLVDTEIDDQPKSVDAGVVCYERFTKDTWIGENQFRNPFEWVFDHPSRDLAEWARDHYFTNLSTYASEMNTFFAEYQTVSKLSSFSWRVLYARLLFPIHYLECIEGYYLANSEHRQLYYEEQLTRVIQHSSDHERFLAYFYELAQAPVKTNSIPLLSWLKG